mgnify:CR=1 FL=1
MAGDTSANNQILSLLKLNQRVFFDPSTENDGEIPNQKPSLVLLTNTNTGGRIMTWYKNSKGQIVSKEILPFAKTYNSKIHLGL